MGHERTSSACVVVRLLLAQWAGDVSQRYSHGADMLTWVFLVLVGIVMSMGLGYIWGEARGIRDTECRWSIAVRRAAHPRRPLTEHLPPSERRHWDRVDQPNGTCSACGAPLNAYLMGGYRLHAHLHRPPLTEIHTRKGPNEDWMKS